MQRRCGFSPVSFFIFPYSLFSRFRNSTSDAVQNRAVRTAHQDTAGRNVCIFSGLPSRALRIVSMIGVMGWYLANGCRMAGSVSVGTNPELRYGRTMASDDRALAPSALFAATPVRMASHDIARIVLASRRNTTHQPVREADGRKPAGTATSRTTEEVTRLRTKASRICPFKTELFRTGRVQKRRMMPLVISLFSMIAVVEEHCPIHCSKTPGTI